MRITIIDGGRIADTFFKSFGILSPFLKIKNGRRRSKKVKNAVIAIKSIEYHIVCVVI